jgi:hypothetical protein
MDAKKPAQASSTRPAASRPAASRPAAAKPATARPAAGKPSPKGASSAKKPPQPTSFMNWLGRQVGHVTSAVKSDSNAAKAKPVGGPKPSPKAAAKPAAKPVATATPGSPNQDRSTRPAGPTPAAGGAGMVIYREDKVEEAEMPDRPGVILRRTIIDEVVVAIQVPPPANGPAAK